MRFLKPVAVFVCLFALCGSVGAAEQYVLPDQKIEGIEDKIEPGDLADVFVRQPKNPPQYLVSSSYDWYVFDLTTLKQIKVRKYDDADQGTNGVYFGTGMRARKLYVACFAVHLYVEKDKAGVISKVGSRSKVMTATLDIGNPPTPPPGPGPGPGPNPNPEPADGTFGLTKFAWKLAYSKVPETSRIAGAGAYSRSLKGIAAAIVAGTLSDPREILVKTAAANRSALMDAKVSANDWDAFGIDFQNELIRLRDERKLVTKDDFAAAWNAIAAGLDAVK